MKNNPANELLMKDLETSGFLFISKNNILSEDFIEANADKISTEEIWISLIRNQKHINSDFFYKFSDDMAFRVHVILLRRRISDVLKKISI